MSIPRTPHAVYTLCSILVGGLVVLFALVIPFSHASAHRSTPIRPLHPTLDTSCPSPGTARAASLPPLTLGSHATIVYIVNEGTPSQPTFGTLKRYDVVTGAKVEIVKLANTFISEAQVSDDGQWLLFVASVFGQAKLQLVRMDGQDLQTLYCNSEGGSSQVQWSATQHFIVFVSNHQGIEDVWLLDVTNGKLQKELSVTGGLTVFLRTWLDQTHVYITGIRVDNPPTILAILDTSKGPNQDFFSLPVAFDASNSTRFCWDFDSSFDATQLFVSQCTTDPSGIGVSAFHGPGVITVRPAMGQSYTYLFVDQHLGITAIRAVTKNTLLFTVGNTSKGTNLNGLWKVGTDGSSPMQLTTVGQLNQFTQFPWSNVSRDGTRYALQIINATSSSTTYTLEYGSLSGGSPIVFASITNVQLATVGWTTM